MTTISGFPLVRKGLQMGDPSLSSIRSLLPLVDDLLQAKTLTMSNNIIAPFLLVVLPWLLRGQQAVFVHPHPQVDRPIVQIAETVTFPDIQVQLGRDIPFEDFTVGITPYRAQADYIITRREVDAGMIVRLDNCDAFPDLSILYGVDVRFPDVRIEFRDDHRPADILIYTEKTTVSEQELLACLLPLIKEKKAQR